MISRRWTRVAGPVVAVVGAVAAYLVFDGGRHGPERTLTLYTHCGVWSAFVDGQLWFADPPLHDGSHNPPRGWGANETRGTWRLTAAGRAAFRADSGVTAEFTAAPAGAEDPAEGCE